MTWRANSKRLALIHASLQLSQATPHVWGETFPKVAASFWNAAKECVERSARDTIPAAASGSLYILNIKFYLLELYLLK